MNSIKALWRPILLRLPAPVKLLPITITSIIITDLLKTKFLFHCNDDMPKSLFDNIMLFDGDLHLLDLTIDIFRDEEKECGLDSPRKVLTFVFINNNNYPSRVIIIDEYKRFSSRNCFL